jgi:hypothetical protein
MVMEERTKKKWLSQKTNGNQSFIGSFLFAPFLLDRCLIFFLVMEGRTKKNGPTQLENRLGFCGELMEFNHSLVGFFFSRFLLVGLFSFLVQKKENGFLTKKSFFFFFFFCSFCSSSLFISFLWN